MSVGYRGIKCDRPRAPRAGTSRAAWPAPPFASSRNLSNDDWKSLRPNAFEVLNQDVVQVDANGPEKEQAGHEYQRHYVAPPSDGLDVLIQGSSCQRAIEVNITAINEQMLAGGMT